MRETTPSKVAEELENRDSVRRATAKWDGCDIAAVVFEETDISIFQDEFSNIDCINFSSASYTLLKFDLDNN